ncbi:hypothetical protein [Mesorhizobium sp. GR13]|uniref:hypothetical protein n=1 Tax=Mesorhizobium sp. GR13 TaxID=2562308 RepID=UPI0010BFA742|nr:hypothetical protein [Mesorhizobium sp. GR13]
MAVHSNSTTLPKIDRAAVMRTAWAHYRSSFTRSWRKDAFNRSNFAYCLTCAWQKHREAQMSPSEQHVARVEREIDMLKYKSLRYDIAPMQRRLEAELAALAA